jgi:hypothetical protein
VFAGTHGDFFGFLVEHVGVGVELEVEVGDVDDEQDNGCAAGELGDGFGGGGAELVEAGGDDDASDCEGEEAGGGLGDGLVEELFFSAEAAEEETHSHDEKEIG